MSKNWTYSWLWKSSKTRQQYCRSESFAMKTDILIFGSMVQKPHVIKNGIRIQCNTENFVPIVVPGLSSSSSSGSHPSTSMTPSRQERHCSTSSSSSCSPTTSLSDSESREREDQNVCDIFPVHVSSFNVDDRTVWNLLFAVNPITRQPTKNFQKTNWKETMIRTVQPVVFWNPGVAARIQRKFGGWWNSRKRRHSRQFFSWSVIRAHIRETWGFVQDTAVYTLFPQDRNCEICQKTEITRAPCRRRNGWASQGPQWQLQISKQSPLNGSKHIHAKHEFHRNPEKLAKVLGAR